MEKFPMSFRRIVIDLFFKAPFIGFTTILSLYCITAAILQYFGIGSNIFYLRFTLNNEPSTGWPLYLFAIIIGPVASLAFTLLLWPFLTLGLWILSKFRTHP